MTGYRHLKSRRAFTLAEMVVVMAVMSIMTMMVISFILLCHAWSEWGTNRYNLTMTERSAETLLRQFISCYDSQEYYFEASEDREQLVAKSIADPTTQYAFSYNGEDALEFERTEGEDSYRLVDYVNSIRFSVRTNAQHEQLITMRIAYQLPDSGVGMRGNKGYYEVFVCTRATGAKV